MFVPYTASSETLKDEPHDTVESPAKAVETPEKKIKSFSPSNCYSYVSWRIDQPLPDDAVIRAQPGLSAQSGLIAVFYYPSSNLWHFAYVEGVLEDGIIISECNYDSGKCGVRIIKNDYYALKGFYALKVPNQAAI